MKRLVAFEAVLLFLWATGQAVVGSNHLGPIPLERDFKPSVLIAGGEETEAHDYPYQVGLDIRRNNVFKHFCGGALVTYEWILTAANCVNFTSVQVTAILGAHNLSVENYGRHNLEVEKIVINPQFDDRTLRNDIALLQINKVQHIEDFVKPIRLPSRSQKEWWFFNWPATTITGWGYLNDGSLDLSPVLRSTSSRVIPILFCQLLYLSFNIGDTHLCVSGWFSKGICAGDTGDPMVINDTDGENTLIGIASFNSKFGCDKSIPMGFTKVTTYLDWIHKITGLAIRT